MQHLPLTATRPAYRLSPLFTGSPPPPGDGPESASETTPAETSAATAAGSQAAPSGDAADISLPQDYQLPITPLSQGQSNGCGTTSLAMVLNALAEESQRSTRQARHTRESLDQGNRPWDMFTAPDRMRQIAQGQGTWSALQNQLNFEQIQKHLVAGHYLIPLSHVNRDRIETLHYSVIHGYRNHADPAQREILITDPASPPGQPATRWANFDAFCRDNWEDIRLKGDRHSAFWSWQLALAKLQPEGFASGFDRFAVVVSGQDDLSPGENLPHLSLEVSRLLNTGANAADWVKRLWERPRGQ